MVNILARVPVGMVESASGWLPIEGAGLILHVQCHLCHAEYRIQPNQNFICSCGKNEINSTEYQQPPEELDERGSVSGS